MEFQLGHLAKRVATAAKHAGLDPLQGQAILPPTAGDRGDEGHASLG